MWTAYQGLCCNGQVSVCTSVCPIDRQQLQLPVGLLLSALCNGHVSVCTSVCPVDRQQLQLPVGLLLSALCNGQVSVCMSHRSTVITMAGGFAAERPVSRKYIYIIDSCGHAVGTVLQASALSIRRHVEGGLTQTCCH